MFCTYNDLSNLNPVFRGVHLWCNSNLSHGMSAGAASNQLMSGVNHFDALKQIIPEACRLILFDYDDAQSSFHPEPDNQALYEWKRKNIENYLLSPDAWIRASLKELNINEGELFAKPVIDKVNDFFSSENLTLPPGKKWKNLSANVFKVVDGKRILFENEDSLFQILRRNNPSITLIRETVAVNMKAEEVHNDVFEFFEKLKRIVDAI